ncbi:hypothetical protein [Yoonia sp. 208BN28-4]|uniref:hypothetical protein n=1 Tax=Yoonia sp. 208BN28-4 TaxID=3126505 RepID=UPI0030B0AB12
MRLRPRRLTGRRGGTSFGKWGDRVLLLVVIVLSPVLLIPIYMGLSTLGDGVATVAFLATLAVIGMAVTTLVSRWKRQEAAKHSEAAQDEAERILDEMREKANAKHSIWKR